MLSTSPLKHTLNYHEPEIGRLSCNITHTVTANSNAHGLG